MQSYSNLLGDSWNDNDLTKRLRRKKYIKLAKTKFFKKEYNLYGNEE